MARRRKYTTDWVSKPLREILTKYDVTYYTLFGEREDGKSYAVKDILIEEFMATGKKFVYLRRTHTQIVRKKMIQVFGDMQSVAKSRLNSMIYFDSQMGFYIINSDGEKQVIGYCTSIQDAMGVKSIPLVDIKYILFDEFIDYNYFENEISMFLHTISTICRPPNENVKIFMLGNTISKNCPYFKLFGIEPTKMRQGEPYYLHHSLGVDAVVYHTPTKVDDLKTKTKHNKYIGFDDNESVSMIMFGEWEYQHCITKQIDGVGWNCMRHLVPMYYTALGMTYEFTLNMDLKIPIAFIRKVNIQYGKCKPIIKYNFTYDRTVNLISKNGIVPSFTSMNDFIDDDTKEKWEIVEKCINCGRVIFDTIETGSEFLSLYKKMGT